jgi:hypothetical protein
LRQHRLHRPLHEARIEAAMGRHMDCDHRPTLGTALRRGRGRPLGTVQRGGKEAALS